MADFEREDYLRKTKAEAWDAFRQGLLSGVDAPQLFAHAIEIYERELGTQFSVAKESYLDYAKGVRSLSDARDIAYEVVDELDPERPMTRRMRALIAELDKVLGPDLVREADPTGKFLKSLPAEERERILGAIDSGSKVIFVEDEMGPILEKARRLRKSGEDQ